ncbi:MFS general substrate transporter [Teratosphaeria nubilosa]|uniref:MFS general substrate transporter n=1 Tax=Teratosphaeria nubilosa TaxID=161662 RepID=A0A6G1L4Y1_9PEZI|nr:MFS general substrate transporter [Teratosphaeria nubilosa]
MNSHELQQLDLSSSHRRGMQQSPTSRDLVAEPSADHTTATPTESQNHSVNDRDHGCKIGKEAHILEGDSETARLDRLGRERPEKLKSLWREIGFVFSIAMSQVLTEYAVSGFIVLLPVVTEELNIPAASTTWSTSALSLVVSAFLLPFGRLADIYGGFSVYIGGCIRYAAWSLIAGFAHNELMLDFCRALQGLGPAAYLPASLTLLGSMYRPGPRKNVVFSIYGAMAAFGFFVGIFFAGIAGSYAGWRWYFYIGTILTCVTALIAYFTVAQDYQEHKDNGVKMDCHAPRGWSTPYIYITLIVGVLVLAAAFYVEGWIAEQPLLPFQVFKIKYVRPFILGLLFTYGTLGIYLLYGTLYMENILNKPPMLVVAWYVPLAVGGCTLATLGGLILHRIPGTYMMAITGVAIMVDSLLFAILPKHPDYWAWIFPAMTCATIAIDLIYNVANIFFSTTLPARQQGLAGALSTVLLQLSIAILLAFADVVVSNTAYQGLKQSYKNAFWFEMACGGTALIIFMGFVRIGRAESDLTADEKEAQRAAEGTCEGA